MLVTDRFITGNIIIYALTLTQPDQLVCLSRNTREQLQKKLIKDAFNCTSTTGCGAIWLSASFSGE